MRKLLPRATDYPVRCGATRGDVGRGGRTPSDDDTIRRCARCPINSTSPSSAPRSRWPWVAMSRSGARPKPQNYCSAGDGRPTNWRSPRFAQRPRRCSAPSRSSRQRSSRRAAARAVRDGDSASWCFWSSRPPTLPCACPRPKRRCCSLSLLIRPRCAIDSAIRKAPIGGAHFQPASHVCRLLLHALLLSVLRPIPVTANGARQPIAKTAGSPKVD